MWMASSEEIPSGEGPITISRHDYRRLLRRTNKLMRLADPNDADFDRLTDLREAILQPLAEGERFHAVASSSNTWEKVLGTAELADGIFTHLDMFDLFALQITSRGLCSAIQTSTVAQRRMFLEPDENSDFTVLDQRVEGCMPGVPSWTLGFPTENQTSYDIDLMLALGSPNTTTPGHVYFNVRFTTFDLDATHDELPPTLRALFLCQPPLKTLEVRPRCGCFPFHTGTPLTPTSARGFTIGELLDTVRSATAAHVMCAHASAGDHDSNGFVRSEFTCTAQLDQETPGAPTISPKNKISTRKKRHEVFNAKKALFSTYIAAKQTAATNGRPVPTFAKWRKGIKQTIRDAERAKAGKASSMLH